MQSTPPSPDPRCGLCRHYEPSRDDRKYGYCKPRERLEWEQHGRPAGKLVDVDTRCFMSGWDGQIQKPAFEAKP